MPGDREGARRDSSSAFPQLPLLWTEWNVPGHDELRDTSYVGPSLANTIRECDGLVDMMSFWVFSDVFEEGGPIPRPFEGHFGLRAKGGINKPSFYEFGLLHQLWRSTHYQCVSQHHCYETRRRGACRCGLESGGSG